MKRDNKKKALVLSVVGLIGLIVITIGITYAIFTYTKLGTTDNTVTSGTLKFLYTENTGVKTGIQLTNTLPISDTQGKALDGDNNVFDFSIEATNTGTEVIPYEVTLRKKDTSTLAEKNVKVYLTDKTEAQESSILEPTNFNKLSQTNIDVGSEIEKTIYNGTVNGGEVSYKKDFRLRMWIDEASNQTDINGKEFTAMVNVYSNAKVISETEQELRSNADIESITIGDNVLTNVTDKDWSYEIQLDNPYTLKLNVIPKYALASVKIEKDNQVISNNSAVSLTGGDNIYKVTITSTDQKNTKEYKINIKVKQVVSIFDGQNTNYVILKENAGTDGKICNTWSVTDGAFVMKGIAGWCGSGIYFDELQIDSTKYSKLFIEIEWKKGYDYGIKLYDINDSVIDVCNSYDSDGSIYKFGRNNISRTILEVDLGNIDKLKSFYFSNSSLSAVLKIYDIHFE